LSSDTLLSETKENKIVSDEILAIAHQSSRTTEIYTHVSTKKLGQIKSPLENLIEHGSTGPSLLNDKD